MAYKVTGHYLYQFMDRSNGTHKHWWVISEYICSARLNSKVITRWTLSTIPAVEIPWLTHGDDMWSALRFWKYDLWHTLITAVPCSGACYIGYHHVAAHDWPRLKDLYKLPTFIMSHTHTKVCIFMSYIEHGRCNTVKFEIHPWWIVRKFILAIDKRKMPSCDCYWTPLTKCQLMFQSMAWSIWHFVGQCWPTLKVSHKLPPYI